MFGSLFKKKETKQRYIRPALLNSMGLADRTVISGVQMAECILINEKDYNTDYEINGMHYKEFYKENKPRATSKWLLIQEIDIQGYVSKVYFQEKDAMISVVKEQKYNYVTSEEIAELKITNKAKINGDDLQKCAYWIETNRPDTEIIVNQLKWRQFKVDLRLSNVQLEPMSEWNVEIKENKERLIAAIIFKGIK